MISRAYLVTAAFALLLLPLNAVAETPQKVAPKPQEILRPQQKMRVLPGQLDDVLVFNSNSPELVLQEGILLSSFPESGKTTPQAHLDCAFSGRFDIFSHHIAKGSERDLRTLYHAVVAHNPGKQPVTVDTLQAASYLSQPDAPFIQLPADVLNNNNGKVYAGPGSRGASDILRGRRQDIFAPLLVIPPGESRLIFNLPITIKDLEPPINGRSTIMRMRSTGPIHLASLALFAKTDAAGTERAPNLAEWLDLIKTGKLSSPRDKVPTPIGAKGNLIYGRVAGVAKGSQWNGYVTDPGQLDLKIPNAGQAFSYGISTLYRGTLGTGQNQSAKMLDRYSDTAYESHGNYAVQYALTLPLVNTTDQAQTVQLTFETPLKREDTQAGLRFYAPLPKNTFFRGTVRFRYNDDRNLPRTQYFHLVQKRGQQGAPLVTLKMPAGDRRLVKFDVIYPADSTPPQVLTVKTIAAD
ncbi:DUF3370 domain-containing protein [filamentous cyanobacterium LEGE 11480]|uniref:DUF3370 domain-containing protein n=1 Tax=Romeriopsis navalis LEGE 11480 TaxID=2777977 RepID=A0A928VM66_9CYAN|nr:DUF3370 domain-containing protein [Romeriopsis navalis]MBE9030263.1 DUF3370 domain-containing protein [Romeriopsis navalis LEGE 11480]